MNAVTLADDSVDLYSLMKYEVCSRRCAALLMNIDGISYFDMFVFGYIFCEPRFASNEVLVCSDHAIKTEGNSHTI